MTQAKVWKMREYWMYFPFFILHDWGKRSAEARSSHYAVLPYFFFFSRWDSLPSNRSFSVWVGMGVGYSPLKQAWQ